MSSYVYSYYFQVLSLIAGFSDTRDDLWCVGSLRLDDIGVADECLQSD